MDKLKENIKQAIECLETALSSANIVTGADEGCYEHLIEAEFYTQRAVIDIICAKTRFFSVYPDCAIRMVDAFFTKKGGE